MLAMIFGGGDSKEGGGAKSGGKGQSRPPQPRPMTADRWRSMARRHNETFKAKKNAG